MSNTYTKHLYGNSLEVVSNPVNCADADLSSSHSATLEFAEIDASGHVAINVDHAATLRIGKLRCASATVNVSYSSTLRISDLECSGRVKINVIYSSTFLVEDGAVDEATGEINYSSLGKFYASMKQPDGVVAKNSSTWIT